MNDDCVSVRFEGVFCGGRDSNGEVVTIEECEKDNKELEIKFLRKRIAQLEKQLDKAVRYLEQCAQVKANATTTDTSNMNIYHFIKRYKENT